MNNDNELPYWVQIKEFVLDKKPPVELVKITTDESNDNDLPY